MPFPLALSLLLHGISASASEYPYLDSVRDGAVAAAAYLANSSGTKTELPSARFGTGKIQVAVNEAKGRADLVVFIPGIQQGVDHPYAKLIATLAHKGGAHTLVIPAPFSDDYRAEHPKALPGTFPEEAQVDFEVVSQLMEKLGPERIKGVKIVGLSYGGFLATMVAARLKLPGGTPVSLHLISPPANMYDIAFRLDSLMDSQLRPFDASYGWKDVAYAALPSFYGPAAEERAAKAFAWIFYNDQRTIIGYLQKEFQCRWKPSEDEVRFLATVENCTPANLALLKSPRATLAFWVSRIPATTAISTITSNLDPFANFESLDADTRSRLGIWIMPTGGGSGHNGFLTTTEFQRQLIKELNLR